MSDKNYEQLKKEAVRLRKIGLSYSEIKKKINVSKSTLSSWLKLIPLKLEDKKRLYTKNINALSRGPQSQKERRIREIDKIIEKAEREIPYQLSFETYQLFGAALYWGEGSKSTSLKITNSDPSFILFMVRWLKKVFGISPKKLKAWLNIYPKQNELNIKKFWSKITGIPLKNFGKSFVKPLHKGYRKNNLYHGTISIKVDKGTDMRHRIFGWIKATLKNTTPGAHLRLKQWKSFKQNTAPVNILEKTT